MFSKNQELVTIFRLLSDVPGASSGGVAASGRPVRPGRIVAVGAIHRTRAQIGRLLFSQCRVVARYAT